MAIKGRKTIRTCRKGDVIYTTIEWRPDLYTVRAYKVATYRNSQLAVTNERDHAVELCEHYAEEGWEP